MPIYPVFNEVTGKKTHGNPMSQAKGSARLVENFETSRDNIYKKPRGRVLYSDDTTLPNANVNAPMQYDEKLLLHYSNNTIYYDSTGTPGDFVQALNIDGSGTFNAPDSDFKVESLEYNNNLYITTDSGIKKLSTYGSTFSKAGCPKGLSADIRFTSPAGGTWLLNNYYVAYRHLWSIKDANNNKIVGAPSERQEIQNTTGGTVAVEHRIYIPDDITTSHMLELYRTSDLTSSPQEDEQLVYQINPTSTDIINGYITVVDITPSSFRGAKLYTNTTQEGIEQANEIPPLARTIDKYKNFVFYANINNLHRLFTSLISTSNLTAGVSTIKFDDGTNNFTMGCYAVNAGKVVTATANNGSGLIRITIGAGHTFLNGDFVRIYDVTGTTEANGIWEVSGVTGTTLDLVGSTYTNAWVSGGTVDRYEDIGSTPRFILYTSGTVAQNIDNTSRSIVRCLNQTTANTFLYGYITSNVEDPPGKMMFTNRTLRDVAFYMTVNSTATGANFSPVIPISGTTYISTNDRLKNAFMWSKANEPEAVPLINIDYAGSSNDAILKIVGLRDAVFIIKENEGIYQLTGESAPFNVDEFDGTVKCLQKDSITKGQNSIFMMSNLGYVKISNAGVEVIGRDNEYQDLKPTLNTNFDKQGKAWFYEDEKVYKTATMKDENSTQKDVVKIYNTFNSSWVDGVHGVYTNDGHIGGGIIIGKYEYTYGVTGRSIYKERKSFKAEDFCSPNVNVTISSIDVNEKSITLSTSITIPNESILTQTVGGTDYVKRIVQAVNNDNKIYLNNVNNLTTNIAFISPGIESKVEFNATHCGSPFVEKFIKQLILQFDAEETSIENIVLEIRTDKSTTPLEISMIELPANYWGKEWTDIWGTRNEVDKFLTWATKEHTQCSIVYIKIKHTAAVEQLALSGYAVDFDAIAEGRNKWR